MVDLNMDKGLVAPDRQRDRRMRLGRALGCATVRHDLRQMPLAVAAHMQNRVNNQMNRQPAPQQHARDGINQKRHVVIDDLNHRMIDRPTLLGRSRIENAEIDTTGLADLCKLPDRIGHFLAITRRKDLQIGGQHMRIERFGKNLRRLRRGRGGTGGGFTHQALRHRAASRKMKTEPSDPQSPCGAT